MASPDRAKRAVPKDVLRRSYAWLDDRLGISSSVLPVLRHPVPKNVNWWYVFGSATLVAFTVQVITGVALAFSYVPAPNSAYETLEFITHEATLGSIVRGIHYWGASAMVVLVVVHMARVFMMGSYKFPREMNWVTGVFLFLLTLGMAFTGQLLRWDQDAYWAVVVSAEMAGRVPVIGDLLVQLVVAGQTVGGATLTRFYATHVFLLPALMFGLIGIHLYLVIRKGISEPPEAGVPVDPETYEQEYHERIQKDGVPFWPDAAWRDVIFALAVGVVVVALAIVPGPKELGAQADPTNFDANPRPDWYFLPYFALLALTPPQIEAWLMVGVPIVLGVVLLAVPFISNRGERSPRRRPWAALAVGLPLIVFVALWRIGVQAPWSPHFDPGPLPASVTQGLDSRQQHGAELFESHGCINCHAVEGVGGEKGPDLTDIGDQLSEEQMTWRILGGGGQMPPYAETIKPQDLDDLIAFLSTLRASPADETTPTTK